MRIPFRLVANNPLLNRLQSKQTTNCIRFSCLSTSKQIKYFFRYKCRIYFPLNFHFMCNARIVQVSSSEIKLFVIFCRHSYFTPYDSLRVGKVFIACAAMTHVELSYFCWCFSQCHFSALFKQMYPFVFIHKSPAKWTSKSGILSTRWKWQSLEKSLSLPVHLNEGTLMRFQLIVGHLVAIKRRIILPFIARLFFPPVACAYIHQRINRAFFHFTILCTSLLLDCFFLFLSRCCAKETAHQVFFHSNRGGRYVCVCLFSFGWVQKVLLP